MVNAVTLESVIDKDLFEAPKSQVYDRFRYIQSVKYLIYDSPISLNRSQALKVAAVAVAAFCFFSLQLGFALPLSATFALTACSITWISEKLRGKESNWFHVKEIEYNKLFFWLGIALIVIPTCIALLYPIVNVVVQAAAQKVLEGQLQTLFFVTLLGPINEEILFRGFLQERIEDLASLTDRYIYPISENTKEFIGRAGQALAFAISHIRVNRMIGVVAIKVALFVNDIFSGFFYARIKNNEHSLVSPMILHAASNTGIVVALYMGRSLAFAF